MKKISMEKIEFTQKAIVQAVAVGVVFVAMLLLCVSERVGIGQAYQCVSIDGEVLGYTAEQHDIKELIQQVRREVSLESGERVCAEIEWETESCRTPFQKLMSEAELHCGSTVEKKNGNL